MTTKISSTVVAKRMAAGAMFVAALFPVGALGNPMVAQSVGVNQAIVNEFGRPLKGTDSAASLFGLAEVEGDLIQVLQATDGKIYPPSANGQPDPRNVVIKTTRIGRGVVPATVENGMFGATLSPRPGGNSKIFVRVFNAPSQEAASFYGDSQLFTVKSFANEVFMANIASTSQPLDSADDDQDGLNNSWEKSYGSNPRSADSDGDGQTDGEEIVAGTDLLDAESAFVVAKVQLQGGSVQLSWNAVAGQTYVVERNGLTENGYSGFNHAGSVVASSAQGSYAVGNSGDACAMFRVKAVR
jgi:hypothetical protein